MLPRCRLLCWTFVPAALAMGSLPAENVPPRIVAVELDGVAATPRAGGSVRMPNGTRDVHIGLEAAGGDNRATRLRYWLEGFDSGWQDPREEMRAVIHFLDAQGLEVGASATYFSGNSSGWRGTIEKSELTPRNVEAVAPQRAERAYIEFVSGGTERALGAYAFAGFAAEVTTPSGETQEFTFNADSGTDLASALGKPAAWQRQGQNPAMAVVMTRAEAAPQMLALRDDDSRSYCAWRLAPASALPVQPGGRVRAHWREAYSVGAGGSAEATYRYLRPGVYRFHAAAATAIGEPLGATEFSLTVRPPWWQEPWAWLVTAGLVSVVVAFTVRRATHRNAQKRMAKLERERSLASERARISQDIHDDLGASLAQIAMLSELVQPDLPASSAAAAQLNEIYTRAHAAGRKLDEIVWALNPAHDSAEDLVGYIARFAQDYLSLARIRFRLDVPPSLTGIPLTSAQRHQLFLAVKEALHNAARHSGAGEIILRVRVEVNQLILTVSDNGCGIAQLEESASSRGSANMRARLEKIGGQFSRTTTVGAGTTVTFQIPLQAFAP